MDELTLMAVPILSAVATVTVVLIFRSQASLKQILAAIIAATLALTIVLYTAYFSPLVQDSPPTHPFPNPTDCAALLLMTIAYAIGMFGKDPE